MKYTVVLNWTVVRRRAWRALKWFGLLCLIAIAGVVADGWKAFGHRAEGARRARMERSLQWKGGHFENPQPLVNDLVRSFTGAWDISAQASPSNELPTVKVDPRELAIAPASGLRVTWLGHASTLVEIDGARVLTDPIWSERASPFTWIGPRRYYAPPIALAALPPIDAVVISHDHYDHLDYRTIVAMKDWKTTFVVPLGVGAHLAYWGVPEARIVELDWWQRTQVGALEIVCTPARHASGRHLFDNDAKLWAGYALLGAKHRVFFSGDTGLFPAMSSIGNRLGPFDVTMLEIGQYNVAWPDWHMGPERAVEAHVRLRGRVLLAVHWGLFTLAYHGWTEPIERLLAAARPRGVSVLTPKPGELVEPEASPILAHWWPALPWQSAAQSPLPGPP
jgi:L-ascorbate metabolism protein UlaG (beta-lactamase superfamily)